MLKESIPYLCNELPLIWDRLHRYNWFIECIWLLRLRCRLESMRNVLCTTP